MIDMVVSITKPETEREYWIRITQLEFWGWEIKHDSGPHISNEDALKLDKMFEEWVSLGGELFELFGVLKSSIVPKKGSDGELQSAPPGMEWYSAWYSRMKKHLYKEYYEELICSACPFSGGFDQFFNTDSIPCCVFKGCLSKLVPKHKCGMVAFDVWSPEDLMLNVYDEGGAKDLASFVEKLKDLKEKEVDKK